MREKMQEKAIICETVVMKNALSSRKKLVASSASACQCCGRSALNTNSGRDVAPKQIAVIGDITPLILSPLPLAII
jgi:hypothetical protein